MKYIKEYLETVVKIKPLGELTTKEDELNDLSGEMVYIDGKCTDIFISHADYANWLESKYEQKSVDKAGPRFKVGDWIVYNRDDYSREIIQVYDIRDGRYYFTDNVHFSWSIKECDEKSHLWSIKDAKPGDVIAEDPIERHPSSFVAIYKKQNEEDFEDFDSYCFVGFDGKFYENEDGHCSEDIHPATKEQRDMLFKKMHESGYEWGAEKKELRKIKQNPTEWSEEDEEHLNSIISDIKTDMGAYPRSQEVIDIYNDDISFLKSLKNRVQPKQEWSEEDEKMVNDIIAAIDTLYYHGMVNWLKSIKDRVQPQSQWKPSDDQMHSLKQAIDSYTFEPDYLEELYEDLKELKGE